MISCVAGFMYRPFSNPAPSRHGTYVDSAATDIYRCVARAGGIAPRSTDQRPPHASESE